jgi:hypothetical protein
VEHNPELDDLLKQAAEAEAKAQEAVDHDLKQSWKDCASGSRFMAEVLGRMKSGQSAG